MGWGRILPVVLVLVASPFDLLPLTPPDGLGLNPVLRDGGMLIHPPVVLAGFAAFAIRSFSFAIFSEMDTLQTINHEGHQVTRRKPGTLRVPSCPW